MKSRVRPVATLAALSLVAGCGTRMSHSDVVVSVGEPTVTLAPESVEALKQAAVGAAPATVATPVAGAPPAAGAVNSAVVGAPVSAPGGTTSLAPAQSKDEVLRSFGVVTVSANTIPPCPAP